jgi:hypothetical protein
MGSKQKYYSPDIEEHMKTHLTKRAVDWRVGCAKNVVLCKYLEIVVCGHLAANH